MSFRLEPFKAEHLKLIELQPVQAALRPFLEAGHTLRLVEGSYAFTGFDGEKAVGCAGLVEMWPGRDCGWALLSECGPRTFLKVHRAVLRNIEERGARRTEISVDVSHVAGQRWAELLGFKKEGLMHGYTPTGNDAYLYARVRNDRR